MSTLPLTKAKMLVHLKDVIKSGRVAPLYFFTFADWNSDQSRCLAKIVATLGDGPWIVRSSTVREDQLTSSAAGTYLSLLHVNKKQLAGSIEQVITSYGTPQAVDEVLVQPMLTNVVRSGVAFSHDPNNSAPYRIVNWSEGSDTTAVTSGAGGHVWQQAAKGKSQPPKCISLVVQLLNELLVYFNGAPVDFEFAISKEKNAEIIWLLQARPLILSSPPEDEEKQRTKLKTIEEKIRRAMRPHPFLKGGKTVFGVMPDWNPAEIVGIRPKPLALSLYRELVTDSIWAYQRDNYGYRNLRSFPLMPHFFGLPFIDVRLSFNSFIPADLDEGLAGRLVDHYIEQLLAEPTLHDKVEFEIVFSCYTLDLPLRLRVLKEKGFSRVECRKISESLKTLTNRILHPKTGLWNDDAAKLEKLTSRREALYASNCDSLERIYWLLEDAKRYGTLPFAGLARAGFIAVQMLKSLVSVGVFSQNEHDNFLASVSTVSSKLARDRAVLDKATFLARYGHLRPGTYDILSPRYDEEPSLYFNWNEKLVAPEPPKPFSVNLVQMRKISALLDKHGLQTEPVELLTFMQSAIELRELAKFHFTRNLSDALSLISRMGHLYGFSDEQMAYADINTFKEMHISTIEPQKVLQTSVEQGKERYQDTLKISLPPLISEPEDVWAFTWPETAANYITQKQVTAPVTDCNAIDKLSGAIVCIPNADPGFDWLFAYPLAGLITAWGGANSHMAIRAGEMGLPAVIGAGELLYRVWSNSKRLHIDCASRRVEVLS